MNKLIPVTMLVLLVSVLSGCITQIVDSSYSNALGDSAATVTSDKFPGFGQKYLCPDGAMVDSPGKCPAQGGEGLNGNPEPVEVEDCGSVPIEVLVTGVLTSGQKDSTNCFNDALAGCSPSRFSLSGSFGGAFTIKGSQEEGCLISYHDETDDTTTECFFPQVYLESLSESSANSNASYVSVTLIGINLNNHALEDPGSGQKLPLTCLGS